MLEIVIPETEFFNEDLGEFVAVPGCKLQLEHSLLSLSKWESKWKIPFLRREQNTPEQMLDYVRCMTIGKTPPDYVYKALTHKQTQAVSDYISDSMTATTFPKQSGPPSRETITSELVYYWMTASNIPFECEKWHLNRLLTLIRVASIKNDPNTKTKINRAEIAQQYHDINEQRLRQYSTEG